MRQRERKGGLYRAEWSVNILRNILKIRNVQISFRKKNLKNVFFV